MSKPTYKYLLNKLWEQNEATRLEILNTKEKAVKNVELRKQAQVIYTIIKKLRDKSSEWGYMDSLIVNEETKFLYKQWNIEIVSVAFAKLEYISHIIIPLITPNIIYDEQSNDLDFYNSGLEMKTNFFYDLKEETLILKASVYIGKIFGTQELIVPNVKLLVNIDSTVSELH